MHSNTIGFDEPMGWSLRITVVLFINHLEALNSKDLWDRDFLDQLPESSSERDTIRRRLMQRNRERPDATGSSAGRDRVPVRQLPDCSRSPRPGLLKNENIPFDCTPVFAAREDPTSPSRRRNERKTTGYVGQAAHPPIQGRCDNLNLAPDEQPPSPIEIRLRQLRQKPPISNE